MLCTAYIESDINPLLINHLDQPVDHPQLLNCTTADINSSYVNVTVLWSSASNAESAGLAFYHVTLLDTKNSTQSHLANLTAYDSCYNVVLPLQETYNASIIAENKCGQISEHKNYSYL